MINREYAIIITAFALVSISAPTILSIISQPSAGCRYEVGVPGRCVPVEVVGTSSCKASERAKQEAVPQDGGLAVSGTNIYAAWNCYSHVLFTASHDGGKTFANTTLISAPNTNPKTLSDNVTISASGNNVAVMWDSNKTGIVNPEIRTSSDGGNTFGDIVTLNSTSGGINK